MLCIDTHTCENPTALEAEDGCREAAPAHTKGHCRLWPCACPGTDAQPHPEWKGDVLFLRYKVA